jgi:hypothetical protein
MLDQRPHDPLDAGINRVLRKFGTIEHNHAKPNPFINFVQ